MDIRIRQNYEDYEKVQKAFKEFIHALVWESMDIDNCVHEDEVNEHIDKYCSTNGEQLIALVNDSVSKFVKSLYARYKVNCYECDSEGCILNGVGKYIKTDNMELAFQKAAEFYRKGNRPYVEVFDNHTRKFIAKWGL